MFPSTGTLYLAPFSDESLFQVCLKNDLDSSLIYFTHSIICHLSLSSLLSLVSKSFLDRRLYHQCLWDKCPSLIRLFT